jgi:hypothetical protein
MVTTTTDHHQTTAVWLRNSSTWYISIAIVEIWFICDYFYGVASLLSCLSRFSQCLSCPGSCLPHFQAVVNNLTCPVPVQTSSRLHSVPKIDDHHDELIHTLSPTDAHDRVPNVTEWRRSSCSSSSDSFHSRTGRLHLPPEAEGFALRCQKFRPKLAVTSVLRVLSLLDLPFGQTLH